MKKSWCQYTQIQNLAKTTIVDFHRALLHADLCFSNVDFCFLPINQLLISYFISNIKNNFVPHKLSSKI